MNNYEFGRMMHGKCNLAQARAAILESLRSGGGACEAVNGFVNVIRELKSRSGADRVFLEKFDRVIGLNAMFEEGNKTNKEGAGNE